MLKIRKNKTSLNTTDTLIGADTIFEGKLVSKASLRIEGRVTGDIECAGDVTIGEKGVVQSNISARNVFDAGTVQGSVTAKGTLMITKTGKMFGNISVGSLSISEGGVFQGTSKMNHTTEAPPPSNEGTVHEVKPRIHKVEKSAAAK